MGRRADGERPPARVGRGTLPYCGRDYNTTYKDDHTTDDRTQDDQT